MTSSPCVHCSRHIEDHAAENDACAIQLADASNGWKNVFHTVFKYSKTGTTVAVKSKVIEKKSVECPCGINRTDCDYHK